MTEEYQHTKDKESIIKITSGADLYRRYDMWCYNDEVKKDDYLFNIEERLEKLVEYYSQDGLILANIGEISDYLTYSLKINNKLIDSTHLEIGVLSCECDSICRLGDILDEKIFQVTEYVEEISYEVIDDKLVLEII